MIMGISRGKVTFQNTFQALAPSMVAASNMLWSMPMIPAISTMVVLPNHIRKFINAIMLRTEILVLKKSNMATGP